MKRFLFILLSFSLGIFYFESSLHSKTQIQTNNHSQSSKEDLLKKLISKSDYISHVRISSITSSLEKYGTQLALPMSRIKLEVLQNIKGSLKQDQEIRAFGGQIDGQSLYVSHMPRFEKDEVLVLFLANFNEGIFTVGHGAGKVEVNADGYLKNGKKLEEFINEIQKGL